MSQPGWLLSVAAAPGAWGRGVLQGTCEQLKSVTGFPRGLGCLRKNSFQTLSWCWCLLPPLCTPSSRSSAVRAYHSRQVIRLGDGWAFIPQGLSFPKGL